MSHDPCKDCVALSQLSLQQICTLQLYHMTHVKIILCHMTPCEYYVALSQLSLQQIFQLLFRIYYRLSPKLARKDRKSERGRSLRARCDRALSPVPRKISDGSLGPTQPHVVCKEAMSPSVAQCLRAVYAAFVWHEGIVHDAMACASFLKFHPDLPRTKRYPRKSTVKKDAAGPMPARRYTTSEVANLNMNEAVKVIECIRSKERHNSESKTLDKDPVGDASVSATDTAPPGGSDADKESELPPTLRHLLHFWEELSMTTLRVIEQNLILPSCMANSRTRRNDRKDEEKGREKKSNLQKGNLFGEAAGMGHGGGGEKEVMCELCGVVRPHPVTYHMRASHPGCGKHAGGQGYNSAGNFCEGWAGNCGDGGIGGSTWYLMCSRCRDKYHREKRQKARDKTKKVRTTTCHKDNNLSHTQQPVPGTTCHTYNNLSKIQQPSTHTTTCHTYNNIYRVPWCWW